MSKLKIDEISFCGGQFCHLKKNLNPINDFIFDSLNEKGSFKVDSQDEQVYQRERAFQILKCVLSKSEMLQLDRSGQLMKFSIEERFDYSSFRRIPLDSVKVAEREDRIALVNLYEAENPANQSDNWDTVIKKSGFTVEKTTDKHNLSLFHKNKISPLDDSIQVCHICYHVYRLLDATRELLSKRSNEKRKNVSHQRNNSTKYEKSPLDTGQKFKNKKFTKCNLKQTDYSSVHDREKHNIVIINQKNPQVQETKRESKGISNRNQIKSPKEVQSQIKNRHSEFTARSTQNSVIPIQLSNLDEMKNIKTIGRKGKLLVLRKESEHESREVLGQLKRHKKSNKSTKSEGGKAFSRQIHDINARITKKEFDSSIFESIYNYDSITAFPYTLIDYSNISRQSESTQSTKENNTRIHIFFNIIICHDVFDTQEKMKIFFKPILQRYPGIQMLLWNYPGQAYTKFSDKSILNNKFHAECLDKLLTYIGSSNHNACHFDPNKPFFIFGYGSGGAIATYFAAKFRRPRMRGLLLFNALSFVDPHYASVFHDCRNVFSCSPTERPDLPVYFFARFIFSEKYLSKVSAPLALNLYTAVHNPITLKGRMSLCLGVLNHIDIRSMVKEIAVPILSVHGKESKLVRPCHAESFLEGRQNCKTIYEALNYKSDRHNTITTMLDAGHDLLQECSGTVLDLVEKMLVGRYEKEYKNSIPENHCLLANQTNQTTLLCKTVKESSSKPCHIGIISQTPKNDNQYVKIDPNSENAFMSFAKKRHRVMPRSSSMLGPKSNRSPVILDPSLLAFEKQVKSIHNPSTAKISSEIETGTVRQEYMSWRLRRNKKRLSRFQRAARVIQISFRSFMARKLLRRLKLQRAVLLVQRSYRGRLGRLYFLHQRRVIFTARLLQRLYRGTLGRTKMNIRRNETQAQIKLARIWRGMDTRKLIQKIKQRRKNAAVFFQTLWRRYEALALVAWKRKQRNAGIVIQRIFRGSLGRRRAYEERNKFLFSQSQSSRIQFGRKILAEHKIQIVRIQSELVTLDEERKVAEANVDNLLSEIGEFEHSVKELELEMHRLCVIEREQQSSALNNAINYETKDKKIRLDENFSRIITKITDRKDQLHEAEHKLHKISSIRDSKIEQLRTLEKKLVILLDVQEKELEEIRYKQSNSGRNSDVKNNIQGGNELSTIGNGKEKEVFVQNCTNQRVSQLMESTETMMKFGFMSMSMNYFSSLNMVRAMKIASPSDTQTSNLKDEVYNHNIVGIPSKIQKPDDDCHKSHNASFSNERKQVDPTHWGVDDVKKWLASLCLSQHIPSFQEAAVDGPFLCQLTEDDLRNVLGVEHQLHRKKILFNISLLMNTYNEVGQHDVTECVASDKHPISHKDKQMDSAYRPVTSSPKPIQHCKPSERPHNDLMQSREKKPVQVNVKTIIPSLEDLMRWIRNKKLESIKKSLAFVPDQKFDKGDIMVQYTNNIGTSYVETYDSKLFTLNKVDEHGNTVLHTAAQNGNIPIAKFFVQKGANPNHQNKQGQTPGHFAVAYQFFDFASWLFDEAGAGADDLLMNNFGLGPYDGLTNEVE